MASLALGVKFNPTLGGTTDWVYASAVTGYVGPAASNPAMVDGKTYRYRAENADLSQWEWGFGAYTASSQTIARSTITLSSTGSKVSFSAPPTVGIVPFPADILQFDDAMSLTAAQQLQGRANLGMSTQIGQIEYWPTSDVPAGRLKCDGSSYSRATYADLVSVLVKSGAVTFTNGSSAVGWTAHGRSVGDPVKLFTSGTLPTNFTAGTHGLVTAGTTYYVKSVTNANTLVLAATVAGAAITAGSAGTGAHTAVCAPHGDGDGATTFTVPEYRGEYLRAWDNGRGIDASRAMGDLQLDAFQGHVHPIWTSGGNLGSAAGLAQSSGASGAYDVFMLPAGTGPTSDGAHGTPRVASETRPRNVSTLVTIRYAA
jgi:hypothetical protein